MTQVFSNKYECCGCGSCQAICPQKAITFQRDGEGFDYPYINLDICVNCKLCKKVCAFAQRKVQEQEHRFTVGARLKDKEKLKKSQSGGAFTAFAETVLLNGGIVYGASLSKDSCVPAHVRVETFDDLHKVKGSKYVQSDLRSIYGLVMEDLLQGRVVLFSGTPCQIDSLFTFLKLKKVPRESLMTVDLLCYGVPSPGVFNNYIDFLENEYGGKVQQFIFRDKNWSGWHSTVESFIINNKKRYSRAYTSLFVGRTIIRLCCHNCRYANHDRPGDITIGDFWSVEKINPQLDNNRGLSVILTNSTKGDSLLSQAEPLLELWQIQEKYSQRCMESPTPISSNRLQFWQVYNENGPYDFFKKYYSRQKYFVAYTLRFYKILTWGKWFVKKIVSCLQKKIE